MDNRKPLSISYNEEYDVLTINGIKYVGDIFRQFSDYMKPGQWFRFLSRKHGVIEIFYADPDLTDKLNSIFEVENV